MAPKNTLKEKLDKLRREGEERAASRLAEKLGLPYVDASTVPISLDAIKILPEDKARDAKIATVELREKRLAVIATNPELPAAKQAISELSKKYQPAVVVVSPSSLQGAWELYKFVKPEADVITGAIKVTKKRLEELSARLTSVDAVRKEIDTLGLPKAAPTALLEVMIAGALGLRASDIHTEAEKKSAKIRFRIDGLLHDIYTELPPSTYRAFVSRIKLLSGMKLNVREEAQDGRFGINVGDKEVEMRTSVIPAEFGETIVMRILDPSATMVGLTELGLREDSLLLVKKAIGRPNGLILNTGPTGSGKTTTLYAFLRSINSSEIKVITLEDQIEYQIQGVEQTQVDEETGYTFANGLRAIVRQDPDVILVGEVRDLETADIALQAALTGHLVFSTLHSNDAIGAIPRLINLGVKSTSIGPALTLVIAQRLVRILCTACKKPLEPDPALKANIEKMLRELPEAVDRKKYENYKLYEPVGCEQCAGIGYKSRIGIFELLQGGEEIEKTILREASESALR